MALHWRSGFLIGIAVGAGVALFGPMVWRSARPVAKSALRAGVEGYATAKIAAARIGEEVEDLAAEVMHEMNEAKAAAMAGMAGMAEESADEAEKAA